MPAQGTLLTLDLGNTRLKGVLWQGEAADARVTLDGGGDERAWQAELSPLLETPGTAVALGSVVPATAARLTAWLTERGHAPRVIEGDTPVPFPVLVEGRQSLGADRLCNAAAAWAAGLMPAIVIDAGTALTLDALDDEGRYRGGVIFPGPLLLLDGLARGGAKLPRIDAAWPDSPLGRDTREALAAGASWGLLSAAEGLAARLAGEPHMAGAAVVLTGGLAEDLAARWRGAPPRVEPDWVHRGLKALVEVGAARFGDGGPQRDGGPQQDGDPRHDGGPKNDDGAKHDGGP